MDLWALDEVRFEQHGSRCRMWVPPEVRDPVVYHAPTRKGVGYFGAVRLRDGKFCYRRESDKFNGETFWAFMKQLRKASSRSGRRVVVITDNASFHHSRVHNAWRKTAHNRFSLDFLPAYSPELNPIERIWKLTRRQCLHNEYFPRLNLICARVELHFGQWRHGSQTLRRLCSIT
ncbi:MAG: IS630 family transposase [Elusimicrobia bacterium]|nr:IS630 family transposase [Elusimicrobiota bacterium]